MGKENTLYKTLGRAILATTALGVARVAIQPLLYPDNTVNVIAALQGQTVDCDPASKEEHRIYPYDAIAVPGGGIDISPDGIITPSYFEQIRLQAAAIAYIQGLSGFIILLDGQMGSQVDPFINKTYLQNEVEKLSNGSIQLPDESVFIEHNSVNTSGNMRELANIVAIYKLRNIFLTTNAFHMQRAEIDACAWGINAFPRVSEDLILEYYPARKDELNGLYQTEAMKETMRREMLGIGVALFDPRGSWHTRAREIFSAR